MSAILILGLVGAGGLVPLPNVPALPPTTGMGLLPLAACAVLIGALVLFTVLVLRFMWAPWTGRLPKWRPLLVTTAVMFASLALAGVSDTIERNSDRDKSLAINHERVQVAENAVAQLETTYGVKYRESPLVPIDEGDYTKETLTLPDGSVQDCFTVGEGGYYVIRCGGNRPSEGVALKPLSDR